MKPMVGQVWRHMNHDNYYIHSVDKEHDTVCLLLENAQGRVCNNRYPIKYMMNAEKWVLVSSPVVENE